MVGELITLPVRVGIRVTRFWFRALEETVSVTTSATGHVIELLASRSSNGHGTDTFSREETAAEPAQSTSTAQPRPRPEQPPTPEATTIAEPSAHVRDASSTTLPSAAQPSPATGLEAASEPVHVSEEPELVEEFAEPGAEEGAGAEIHVDPPWDGYDQMGVKQVLARFSTADAAELAAVQLYESSHRRRQTILNAVQREMRIANSSGSRTNKR